MKKIRGEIVLIDDEVYEREFLTISLNQLGYLVNVRYFQDGRSALAYLKSSAVPVFLIICDVHMPGMNGIEFKTEIDRNAQLRLKAIPFVFTTSATTQEIIDEAYRHGIQGFFKKPLGLKKLEAYISVIVQYWMINLHPNRPEVRIEEVQDVVNEYNEEEEI